MAIASHTKAAEDHKSAAQAHQAAAECHRKGDHSAALEHSTKAQGCCGAAQKSSTDAHAKSAMQAKK